MRHLLNLFSAFGVALLIATTSYADTASPQEASQYVGRLATIEGVVSQVTTTGGGTTFINFGGQFPNHDFYAVIFRNNSGQFSNIRALEGRSVAISGTVEIYRGKPQIVLVSPDQIKLR